MSGVFEYLVDSDYIPSFLSSFHQVSFVVVFFRVSWARALFKVDLKILDEHVQLMQEYVAEDGTYDGSL